MNWYNLTVKALTVAAVFALLTFAYRVGRSEGATEIGMVCMEALSDKDVKRSEQRKNDSDTLFNLSLMLPTSTPKPEPGPTPTPFKDKESF